MIITYTFSYRKQFWLHFIYFIEIIIIFMFMCVYACMLIKSHSFIHSSKDAESKCKHKCIDICVKSVLFNTVKHTFFQLVYIIGNNKEGIFAMYSYTQIQQNINNIMKNNKLLLREHATDKWHIENLRA
jgi:hypothetical protein